MTDQDGAQTAQSENGLQHHDLRIVHSGKTTELLPIALLNFVLTVVTLGIYRFWARTRVRKYLWSRTEFLGHTLEYRGKGSELFIGFLLTLLAFVVPLIVLGVVIQVLVGKESPIVALYIVAVYFFIFWLFGYAIYSAQRFRLSRTYWRGIRAGLGGARSTYAWKFLGYLLLSIITIGLITPVQNVALYRHVMNNASFGNKNFSYTGTSGPVYGSFFISVVLSVVLIVLYIQFVGPIVLGSEMPRLMDPETGQMDPEVVAELYARMLLLVFGALIVLTLAFSVYQARLVNHFVEKLRLDNLQFSMEPRASDLSFFWLVAGNMLIMLLTLGIGLPFAQMRIFHYVTKRLKMDGEMDFETIQQNDLPVPKYGEGLAELFDAGTI